MLCTQGCTEDNTVHPAERMAVVTLLIAGPMASASPSKVLPAAVLQTEFLSEGCHKPSLPLKDAGRGALPSQREVKNQMVWQVLLYKAPGPKAFQLQRT